MALLTCDVAICGGGLGGLALAAGLIRRGYDVHVFEAAAELRTATSTLIALGPNAFTALEELHPDIVPRLKPKGCLSQASSGHIKASKESEVVVRHNPPMPNNYTFRWSVVQNVLASVVPPEAVHCGYQATGYTEDPDRGVVRLHFKGHPDVETRLAVGADGLRSGLRKTMVPNDPGPRYLGQINWNALIHNPDGSVVDAHKPGEFQSHANTSSWAPEPHTVVAYIIDAGGGYTYWQVRIQCDTMAFTQPPGSAASLTGGDPEASSVHVDAQPYLVGGGLGKPGSKARVEGILEEAGFDHVLKVVQATPESSIFERAMLDRVPLDELGATMTSPSGGRVALMGDAAHAMHSSSGQGARTAFEDAHTLTLLLDRYREELVTSGGWAAAPPDLVLSITPAAATGEKHSVAPAEETASQPSSASPEEAESGQSARINTLVSEPSKDLTALSKVFQGYNDARLARLCRVQRFSAEGCGLESIRRTVRPPELLKEQEIPRFRELHKWLGQYPENPTGDPASQFWKPEEDKPGLC